MNDKNKNIENYKEEKNIKTEDKKNSFANSEFSLEKKSKTTEQNQSITKKNSEINTKKISNNLNCFGLIETNSFVTLVKATDAILKAANVSILKYEKIGNSLVAICIYGDIGSVTAAIEVGIEILKKSGDNFSTSILPSANKSVQNHLKNI